MKARRSERGAALLWAIMTVVLMGAALNAAAIQWFGSVEGVVLRELEDAALFEARGGVRLYAGRLAAGEDPGEIRISDDWGVLTVKQAGGRIQAEFIAGRGPNRKVIRTVSARWNREGTVELGDWRED